MRTIVFLIYLFSSYLTRAQVNLVLNGDFELDSVCPTSLSQINYAVGWKNPCPATSSDYFNSCTNSSVFGVPTNGFGYQFSYGLGEAYAGLYTYSKLNAPWREYIQVKLNDTLQLGKKYLTSMYVSRSIYDYATSIGMYFSSTAIQAPTNATIINIPNPQVKSTTPLVDTLNWMLVQDTVIGTGSELYLTIGNFSPDGSSDTIKLVNPSGNPFAYYFIDNVSVIDAATIGINELKDKEQFKIYPNPANDNFIVDLKNKAADIRIIDYLGVEVYKQTTSNKIEINTSEWNNGVYVLRSFINGILVETKKIMIQH